MEGILKSQICEYLSPNSSVGDSLSESLLDRQLELFRETLLNALRVVESLKAGTRMRRAGAVNLKDEVNRFEAELIKAALMQTGGNQSETARLLDMKESTLSLKIRRYRIGMHGS